VTIPSQFIEQDAAADRHQPPNFQPTTLLPRRWLGSAFDGEVDQGLSLKLVSDENILGRDDSIRFDLFGVSGQLFPEI
jgi:hypothetical protein